LPPYLLFLEKQLVDLHTFVKKLPVLDASDSWSYDASADCYATDPVQTVRTCWCVQVDDTPRPGSRQELPGLTHPRPSTVER
jgi:hypothetical protein